MRTPFYQNGAILYCGDSLKIMPQPPDDSVDLLLTDPPYGISFMGKDWDKALPSLDIWKECFRILKPGAFAFVMSIPRADCLSRMIISLEDAGFMVNFTPIFWAYASGFPKAQNIGKAVDKRNGRLAEEYKALGDYLRNQRGDRPQKKIAQFFPSKTGGLTGCVANWELGLNVPTKEQWLILKRELGLDNRFDKLIERIEAEREVIGREKHWGQAGNSIGIGGQEWNITKSATPQAKALDGSYGGFQPKPAVEVIIVAMKPLSEKTFVDQALKNQKGITWLDDGRIPYESANDNKRKGNTEESHTAIYGWAKGGIHKSGERNNQGRFPANLLVSDDVLNDGRKRTSNWQSKDRAKTLIFGTKGKLYGGEHYSDSGSFSRYFDLDSWAKTFPFLITPKASKGEKNRGCADLPELKMEYETTTRTNKETADKFGCERKATMQNNHPTVKPLKLMSYLITLGSREGDTILDPFVGSGTTALACKLLGRKCIGIEIEEKYCEVATTRCQQAVLL